MHESSYLELISLEPAISACESLVQSRQTFSSYAPKKERCKRNGLNSLVRLGAWYNNILSSL